MRNATAKTKILNVRTTEENYMAVQNLARFEGKSVSAFIMDAVRERIEDWEDIQAIAEYERRKESGEEIKLYTHEEILKKFGIDDDVQS